jgi:hypothetical protein
MAGIDNFRAHNEGDVEQIAVGDFVRSYDFEFDGDSYILGRVQEIGVEMEGCPRYRIIGLKRVLSNNTVSERSGRDYFPPVNGTPHSFGGYCNGVRKCEGEELEYWTEKWADWASDVEIC